MSDHAIRVPVRSSQGDYEVTIGTDLLERLVSFVHSQQPSRVALLVDAQVAACHAQAIATLAESLVPACTTIVEGGEDAKRWERLGSLLDVLAAARLDRRSFVLAVGGGAVSDLAGLAAALWMRGIRWGAVPTTVLAAVDASVGGKVAVNLAAGKNLVGAFHAPRFVLVDPALFSTLPEREVQSGLAEVVKAAVIGDAPLFDLLERERDLPRERLSWPVILQRSIAVKADIVSRDEREGSVRRHLNLGHTLGHALEKAAPERLTHGEAVSIGMVAACDLALARELCAPDVAQRVRALLVSFGLPVHPPRGLEADAIAAFLALDKKNVDARLQYVLPTGIGEVCIRSDVTISEVWNWVATHPSGTC
ncbi:MAG: 3-dehydroquinate synthase [Planctomycetes bacterium]|nr:3-dehydroquinate synthase [Planctomycetota bacterium]